MTLQDGSTVHRYGEITGNNGVSHLDLDVTQVIKLQVFFPRSGAVSQLNYSLCPPQGGTGPLETTPAPTASPVVECPLVHLDFNNEGLSRGTYLHDQLKDKYGLTVTAIARPGTGYTPNGAARIFDTARTGGRNGDTDLGSPNRDCPGGGPGIGAGGGPSSPFANCDPLGYVLIIQESNKWTPDDNARGGSLLFDFDTPVTVKDLSIFDIDEHSSVDVLLTHAGGATTPYETGWTGDNGVYPLTVDQANIKQIKVTFPGSGAVNHIDFRHCPPGWTPP